MGDREKLHEIIRRRSFRVGGSFKLASGRTSSVYLNLKPTMLDPEGARLIGAALAEKAAALGADYVGGLEMGAVPLVAVDGGDERRRRQAGQGRLRPQAGQGTRHAEPGRGPGGRRESSGQEGRRGRGRDDDRRLVA